MEPRAALTDRLPEAADGVLVGSTIRVDRERRVVLLKTDAERSEVDVSLREDGDDLLMQITPEAHLAFVELMKRDGGTWRKRRSSACGSRTGSTGRTRTSRST